MSTQKQTNTFDLKYHYGLALEEVKLERSSNNLAILLNSMEAENKPQYLLNEMAYLERQIRSIQKLRKIK